MIRPPNDESEVVESPLLEPEVKSCPKGNNDMNSEKTSQVEFDFVESLLRDNYIEGYTLSFPSDNTPHLFPLSCNSPSHCPLCDWEHTSKNAYIVRNKKSYSFYCYRANQDRKPGARNLSLKLTISESALDREKRISSPTN